MIDGIAINSDSPVTRDSCDRATARQSIGARLASPYPTGSRPPRRGRQPKSRALRDVAAGLSPREGPQLLQALMLDLSDALARDVERPAHLVERPRLLPIEPVTELEHLALAIGELEEDGS